jgi:hypothetical protein
MIAVGWPLFLYLTATKNPNCLPASLMFRKKKRVAEDDGGYSRQQSRGILIPTSSPAVVDEWTNVKKQVQLWAWEVSQIATALLFA